MEMVHLRSKGSACDLGSGKKWRRLMNSVKIFLASIGLVTALGLLVAPNDSHGCHLGTKHNSDSPCGGGSDGGDGGNIATNDTEVQWIGPNISEGGTRACFLEFASNDGKGGHYKCAVVPGQAVTFSLPLANGAEFDKRGREVAWTGICNPFTTGEDLTPDTNYEVHWEGFCTSEDGCEVRVLNWIFEHSLDDIGLIVVEGFDFDGVVESTNLNPFSVSRALSIDEVVITLKGAGSNRTKAICKFASPGVSFQSDPD
jgi:hypothetical protein